MYFKNGQYMYSRMETGSKNEGKIVHLFQEWKIQQTD